MNYTFFPENLVNLRYDEDVRWFVVDRRDWDNNVMSGLTFSSFSVATAYCRENPSMNFIITEV